MRGSKSKSRQLRGRTMFRANDSADTSEGLRLLDTSATAGGDGKFVGHYDTDGLTPLMYAAHRGQLGMVKLLIARGANNLAIASRWGMTALHFPAGEGHEEVVAYLMHNGAQSGQQDKGGDMPLMEASRRGQARVVVLLPEHMGGQGLGNKKKKWHLAVYVVHEELLVVSG